MSTIVDALLAALAEALPDVPAETRHRVAEGLCDRVGGGRVYLPRRPPDATATAVAAALAVGATIAEAARAAGISERHARRLRGRIGASNVRRRAR